MRAYHSKPRFKVRSPLSFCTSIPTDFSASLIKNSPSMADLEQIFSLSEHVKWPELQWLNQTGKLGFQFIDQTQFDKSGLYYEEIIYQNRQIPTRSQNWHDLFNGLIWHLFPKSKQQLNIQHMEDIQERGLNPRTPRRDRITHFDECGVILAVQNSDITDLLADHQWQQALVVNREQWGREIRAFNFGHANYEMLLNPYIGLTGKWMALEVSSEFWQQSLCQQYQTLDQALYKTLADSNPFSVKGTLKPLPLLGVPGWWDENQAPEFYQDQDYFRPKCQGKRPSIAYKSLV